MNTNWLLDIVIFILLIGLIYCIFRLVKHEPVNTLNIDEQENRKGKFLKKMLRQAGITSASGPVIYWLAKLHLMVLIPLILVWMNVSNNLLMYIVGGMAGFFMTDIWLIVRRNDRRAKIQKSLSYFTDLMTAFLQSGMSLPQAFNRAAKFGLPVKNPLGQEAALIADELQVGRDWSQSFSLLSERTGVKDLGRLSAILEVGFRMGTPVTETLSSQADLLRTRQQQEGVKIVSRKSLFALFPMIFFSMPMFLVLVFFPTGVQIYEAYQLFASSW